MQWFRLAFSAVLACAPTASATADQRNGTDAGLSGCVHMVTAGVAAQSEPLAITIRVRDTARVPDDVMTLAQDDVTRIYQDAGVHALWRTPESLRDEPDAVRQAALTVAILTPAQAARLDSRVADDRAGFAARSVDGEGHVAYVVYDRVQMLTGANGLHRARMLAIVMAHEIGHLLLPFDTHSHTGLMRADWTHADLRLAQRGLVSFATEDARLLRRRISTSRYRAGRDERQKAVCAGRVGTR